MPGNSALISCRGLTKAFAGRTVVDNLDLDVSEGSICAFLGPNGAGKSTTIKMLTGLLKPTCGAASLCGRDVWREGPAVKRMYGVVPEDLGLFEDLTVEEHLLLSGPIYGLGGRESRKRAAELLGLLRLDDAGDRFAGQCSYGMKKKTALALALLHNPRVLFLDEPFEGLDPVTSATLRRLLVSLAARGITIFLTSHVLVYVEELATQIVLLRDGRIVWNSPAGGLPHSLERLYFDLVEAPQIGELEWLGSARS